MIDRDLAFTILIIASLVCSTVFFHYEGLRVLSDTVRVMNMNPRAQMLTIILGVFLIHVIEIAMYGVSYWFGDMVLADGNFNGTVAMTVRDFFYFSAETYTGLGYGDISPTGDLRLVVSIETLNGLLLLGWTTSYTYIAMQRYWDEHAEVDQSSKRRIVGPKRGQPKKSSREQGSA
jgi:hypothetical protein